MNYCSYIVCSVPINVLLIRLEFHAYRNDIMLGKIPCRKFDKKYLVITI